MVSSSPSMANPSIVTLNPSSGLVTISPLVDADIGIYTIQFKMTIGAAVRTSDFVLTVPDPCVPITSLTTPTTTSVSYTLDDTSQTVSFDS